MSLRGPKLDGVDILHLMWQGELGGAERAVFQLAMHQQLDGRRTVGIAYGQARGQWQEQARAVGLRVFDLQMRRGSDLGAAFRALPLLRRCRIHHHHTVEPPLLLASAAVRSAARVYTHRGGITQYEGRQRLRYQLVAPLIRHRYNVTGNTAHATVAARKLFSIPTHVPVAVTYNAMDLSLLQPRRRGTEIRRELGTAEAATVITTAANLRRWKRIDWLIDAVAQLEGDWELWIAGDGPDQERLERLARQSRKRDQIRFLGRRTDIADVLHASDVFALPSGSLESFGNAAVEAMACSLPVIVARDSPGLVEHVADGRTGIVIDDPHDLGATLRHLLERPQLRRSLGQAARRHVEEAYTPARAVERNEAVYERVTGGRSAKTP